MMKLLMDFFKLTTKKTLSTRSNSSIIQQTKNPIKRRRRRHSQSAHRPTPNQIHRTLRQLSQSIINNPETQPNTNPTTIQVQKQPHLHTKCANLRLVCVAR